MVNFTESRSLDVRLSAGDVSIEAVGEIVYH